MGCREKNLDVPESLNCSSVHEFAQAIDAAMQDDTAGAIVLQGTRETFCRGLDFDEIADTGNIAGAPTRAIEDYCRCLRALRFSDKPTVAIVQGASLGGGVGLVAACDVVIATENATFALPEVLFGFAPAMVLPFLLERVPRRTARIWALTAATRTAKEALSEGLVDVVTSEAELQSELRRWLKLLRRGQRSGVKTIKHLCSTMPSLDQSAGLDMGHQSTLAALRDPDVLAAITRFKTEGILPWEAP